MLICSDTTGILVDAEYNQITTCETFVQFEGRGHIASCALMYNYINDTESLGHALTGIWIVGYHLRR